MSLENENAQNENFNGKGEGKGNQEENQNQQTNERFIFMSRDTLVASSFHYCDCVIAREMGLYDVIHSVVRSTGSTGSAGSAGSTVMNPIDGGLTTTTSTSTTSSSANIVVASSNMMKVQEVPVSNHRRTCTKQQCDQLESSQEEGKGKGKENDGVECECVDQQGGGITVVEVEANSLVNNNGGCDGDGDGDGVTSSSYHQQDQRQRQKSEAEQKNQNLKIAAAIQNNQIHTINISSFGAKAEQIYDNVSRLKRVEIMSRAMLPYKDSDSDDTSSSINTKEQEQTQRQRRQQFLEASGASDASFSSNSSSSSSSTTTATAPKEIAISKVSPSPEEAASMRGLLLTMTNGDWNALVIRLSASLYRLRGILHFQHEQQQNSNRNGNNIKRLDNTVTASSFNKEIVREAREALHVYAPLAQRLGMTKLKIELENTAFRILYKRQYIITKSLYMKNGGGDGGGSISTVASYLEQEIENILHSDRWLVNQLERLTINSRVKQPYSLWKKLVKLKKKTIELKKKEKSSDCTESMVVVEKSNKPFTDSMSGTYRNEVDNENKTAVLTKSIQCEQDSRHIPSLSLVLDAIALRVIIKAKSINDETVESKISREEFLCYYIQNQLMKMWPVIDDSRVKDYISQPKPNNYQSLHHTSSLYRFGQRWPFEVQIRSESMHKRNEFGIAAHWDYKLKGRQEKEIKALTPRQNDKVKKLPLNRYDYPNTEVETDQLPSSLTSSREAETQLPSPIAQLCPSTMIDSYIDALDTARNHLLEKSIFIFFLPSNAPVKEGKVLGIAANSSVADALIDICKRCQLNVPDYFDNSKFEVFINGQEANLHDILKTGDRLVVPGLDDRVAKYMM